jgi:hypothetical protein
MEVQADGSVSPILPTSIQLRDGGLIRPVCPFLELWASIGEPGTNPRTWHDVPLTSALLKKHGASFKDLVITVDAKNFKASRRTNEPGLQFGTFPLLSTTADRFTALPILAVSPPDVPADRKMIPDGKSIPLGFFQVIKSRKQPAPDKAHPWTKLVDGSPTVNVEVIRFRFTPAQGRFYGPPSAAKPQRSDDGPPSAPVDEADAFLSENAGWKGADAQANAPDSPSDTYDGADIRTNGPNPSLGVIDDTCEARIEVGLSLGKSKSALKAAASIFVSPPDFAPDRRPFLSLADELNDRVGDSLARNAQMTAEDRDAWVEDLFQRIYETVSLLNLDQQRQSKAIILKGNQLARQPIPDDKTLLPSHAMGGRDALRNRKSTPILPMSPDVPLPLAQHARDRHRRISNLDGLRDFISQNRGKLEKLVRGPFESGRGEDPNGGGEIGTTSMRMPPFMRNSNSGPLTLSAWQYDLLMSWVQAFSAQSAPTKASRRKPAKTAPPKLSDAAAQRRTDVLARLTRIRKKSAAEANPS